PGVAAPAGRAVLPPDPQVPGDRAALGVGGRESDCYGRTRWRIRWRHRQYTRGRLPRIRGRRYRDVIAFVRAPSTAIGNGRVLSHSGGRGGRGSSEGNGGAGGGGKQ